MMFYPLRFDLIDCFESFGKLRTALPTCARFSAAQQQRNLYGWMVDAVLRFGEGIECR
ncbi:hypothetical protein SMB34_12140 [Thalassospira permensis NBRC 106175]|uniref:Uncharacterized protein n=1 Tax=Thalassospira permensis NBRC 106175 TaxID=1353532 RepID=A0ABR4TSH4_9PROT|nr:hypothetical protein SMB34_12140 [Thalassospira permensis NBRC 106175]